MQVRYMKYDPEVSEEYKCTTYERDPAVSGPLRLLPFIVLETLSYIHYALEFKFHSSRFTVFDLSKLNPLV